MSHLLVLSFNKLFLLKKKFIDKISIFFIEKFEKTFFYLINLFIIIRSIETRTTAINHFQNFHSIAFPGEFSGTKKNVKSGNHDKKLSTQEKIIKLATEYQHILPEKGQIKLPVFRKKLDKKTAIFNNITKDRKIDIQKTGIFTNMTMDRTIFCRQPNFVKNSEESDTSSLNEETTRMMRNSSGLAPMMTDFKAMEKKIDEFMSEFKQRQISMNKKLDELICLVNIKPQPDIKTKRKASSNSISSKSSNSSKGDENKMTQKLRKIIKN